MSVSLTAKSLEEFLKNAISTSHHKPPTILTVAEYRQLLQENPEFAAYIRGNRVDWEYKGSLLKQRNLSVLQALGRYYGHG